MAWKYRADEREAAHEERPCTTDLLLHPFPETPRGGAGANTPATVVILRASSADFLISRAEHAAEVRPGGL